MKASVFALSLAALCMPAAALAQNAPGQPMTTTPSVTCSTGAAGSCTLNEPLGSGTHWRQPPDDPAAQPCAQQDRRHEPRVERE